MEKPPGERNHDCQLRGRPVERSSGGSGAVSLSVARLRLSKGAVTFVDGALVKGHSLTTEAREIDLTVTDLSATSSVGVDLAFELAGAGSARLRGRVGPPPAAGTPSGWPIDARLELLDFKGGPAAAYLESFTGVRIRGGSLDLDVTVKGTAPGRFAVAGEASLRALEMNPLAGGGRPVKLDASVDLDGTFASEETRLSRCDVKVGGSSVSVTGVLTGLPDRPAIDVRVVSKKAALADIAQVLDLMGPFLPRGLARKGEIALDANARGSLADPLKMSVEGRAEISGLEYADPALKRPVTEIGGTLALRGATAEIKGFTASLGRSRVTGECVMTRSARPVLDVHLASPLIDLDEVLSLMTTAAPEEAALADGGGGIVVAALGEVEAGQGRPHVIAARRESAPAAPATSILRDVTVRGDVTVERAKIMNLQIESARADLLMERGEARLNGVGLRLYKGGMTGEVAAVLTDPGPPFTLSAALQGVDFNAMASDLSADLRNLIRGTLEAGLDVQGRGLATNDLRRHLTGRGRLALRDGKVASFSVLKGLAKALKAAGGRGIGEDETPFTSLTGTFEIGKGLARTEDLALDSPEIDMRGEGSVGLDLTLDLDLAARISQGVSADMVAKTPALRHLEDKKRRLALDFRLGGTLMEPAVGIDPEMLKRAARSAAKEEIKGKKKDLLRKLLEKD